VPYRLMRTELLPSILSTIPDDFFLVNVAIAVQLRRAKWREQSISIRFRERFGGGSAVKISTFASRACEFVTALKHLAPVK